MIPSNKIWKRQKPVTPMFWTWGEAVERHNHPTDTMICSLEIRSIRMERKTDEIGKMVAVIYSGVAAIGNHIFGGTKGTGGTNPLYSPERPPVGFTPREGNEGSPVQDGVQKIGFRW